MGTPCCRVSESDGNEVIPESSVGCGRAGLPSVFDDNIVDGIGLVALEPALMADMLASGDSI